MVSRGARQLGALLLLTSLLAAGSARGDLIAFFGEERVGTSGGQFLRVPAGARGLALGSGMSATVQGASAPFWNPAGMSRVRGPHRLFVSHMEYVAGIDVDHLGYVRRLRDWQLGLSLAVLRSGEIERTTELHPAGTGDTFNANQFHAGLSVGRSLTDRFSFAGTVKFLQENLDDFENRGIFLDLGALYFVGYNRARIGFTIRNFGPDLQLNGEPPPDAAGVSGWQNFNAPTVAIFGFAYDFGDPHGRQWTASLDFSHPSDEAESVIFAHELTLHPGFFLRGAYRNKIEDGGFSAGFGLEFLRDRLPVRFDYGYGDRGSFGGLHVISLEVGR